MRPFQVLDPDLPLYSHHLLEASAGTGKTFSIENLVVRFLLEPHPLINRPLEIEEILLVTFTRAATYDLKVRIRQNINNAIRELDLLSDGAEPKNLPLADYLQAINSDDARRRLELALFAFDQASIFTIHSFCSRALNEQLFESALTLDGRDEDETLAKSDLKLLVRDFFRTELSPDLYSPPQISAVISMHTGDISKVENHLVRLMTKGYDIIKRPCYEELYQSFCEAMQELKQVWMLTEEKILEDFERQAPHYCKPKKISDPAATCARFAALFSQESWQREDFDLLIRDSLMLADLLTPENLKKKTTPPTAEELHYPDLAKILSGHLLPIVEEARSPSAILTRMAHDCRALMLKRLAAEEQQTYEALLTNMVKGIQNADFRQTLQSRYFAAVIDEFQDTDPLQWEIFSTLFLAESWPGALYLVGDPKQSIYGFRQADIYTYLAAADRIAPGNLATLDTNYRSQPAMIRALNLLFSEEESPGLIALPRLQKALPYRPIAAGRAEECCRLADGKAAVHFFIAEVEKCRANCFPLEKMEADAFFPFIIQEIQHLHQKGFGYRQMAVLVGDRFQSWRLNESLQAAAIPSRQQRSASLADSEGKQLLWELLHTILQPRDESSLKAFLTGRLVGWSYSDLDKLGDLTFYEQILDRMMQLRDTLSEKGFAPFFEALMQTCWNSCGRSITEQLLAQEGGLELFSDLNQIAAILTEEQSLRQCSSDALLAILESFEEMELNEESRLKKQSDPTAEAVNIITMHSSKGLEYDIVFALGTVKRSPDPGLIIPDNQQITAVKSRDEEPYIRHCREIDAEKIRQLYVALTRAKERLYIPAAIAPTSKVAEGRASPMELFLAHLHQPAAAPDALYERINGYDAAPLRRLIAETDLITATELNHADLTFSREAAAVTDDLFPPKGVVVPGKPGYLYSFTSLSRQAKGHASAPTVSAPHDFHAVEKNGHTLPAGSTTGTLLHTILEFTPFNASDYERCLLPHLQEERYLPWKEVIAALIHDTFHADLGGFSLKDVESRYCYHEAEFLYRSQEIEGGYLKGIIDLLFYHRGRYYLLDWKSNWLGPSGNCYSQEALQEAMNIHNYHLQAELYTEAARRYLNVADKRPFEEIFGGTYYLFLRGLKPESGRGVYFIPPEERP